MEKNCLKSHIDCISPLEAANYLLVEKDLVIQKQQEKINNLEIEFSRLKDQYDSLLYLFRITKDVDLQFKKYV